MIDDVMKDAKNRMNKSLDALHRDLNTVRTGRASTSLLDRVSVDYYGTPTPLNQIAGVSVPEARLIVVQPWDKGSIPDIEKALMKADLGLNPSNDGQVIRITIPPLTEDRRKQLVKVVHSHGEDAKISARNIRRDSMSSVRDLLLSKDISEDDERRAVQQLDEITKKCVDEIDSIVKVKEAEVMEV